MRCAHTEADVQCVRRCPAEKGQRQMGHQLCFRRKIGDPDTIDKESFAFPARPRSYDCGSVITSYFAFRKLRGEVSR